MKNVSSTTGKQLTVTGKIQNAIYLIKEKVTYVKPSVSNMLNQGIIIKSTSPYISPLWVVRKKNIVGEPEKFRVVVDYRELNNNSRTEKHPLP